MTDDVPSARLGAATIELDNDVTLTSNDLSSYRAVSAQKTMASRLGPLQNLPGFWEGTGFSLIARPDFNGAN